MWHREIQYFLEEQGVLETLMTSMVVPEEGTTVQHRWDMEQYQIWLKRDCCAHFTMLSVMYNDLIGQFEECKTTKDMWEYLKLPFACTLAAKLRAMTLRFETYKMDPNSTMVEHLRKMSQLIRDLKSVSNNLSDE